VRGELDGAANIAHVTASPSRLGRPLTAAALVVVASLTAAGCGTVSYGAAAVADDRRVPVGELQNATAQIQDIAGPSGQVDQMQVLDWLVVEPWVVDIADTYGVGVSSDDARKLIYQVNPAYDPSSEVGPHKTAAAETVRAVRGMLAVRRIQGQGMAQGQGTQITQEGAQRAVADLQAKVRSADIDVNPRYLGVAPDWLASAESPAPQLGGTSGGQAPEQQAPEQQAPEQQAPTPAPAP
jgi:hypothetical protein